MSQLSYLRHKLVPFFILFLGLFVQTQAYANTETKTEVSAAKIGVSQPIEVKNTLIASVDAGSTVFLDGENLSGISVKKSDTGLLLIEANSIFDHLNNEVTFDSTANTLTVKRPQDRAVMELNVETGIVKANGKALGRLPKFGYVSDERFMLTVNAIAVLTGTKGIFDKNNNRLDFKLDPRLRVATGFNVYINEIPSPNLNPPPRSVGPVMLLPLLPIAEKLGHSVRVLEGGLIVEVRRAQDSAVLTLNMDTGLVKLGDIPKGLTKDTTYIDRINLLIPVNALEALTGTNVTINGGSNRINIDLDERLSGAIEPRAGVVEEASNTPFTPEALTFHTGLDTLNEVNFDFRVKALNGRVRYEVPDLPVTAKEAIPDWLSVDFAHINGVRGSVGDYAADLRELDGVGLRRVRGVSAVKVTERGRWAAVVGAPVSGAKTISKDQSRLTFGGLAGGVRYADQDGWEAGLAIKSDSLTDDQMAVLSAISGSLGRVKDKKVQWNASADIGAFKGPAREKNIDIALNATVNYEATRDISTAASVSYTGSEFLRSRLTVEEQEEEISDILNPEEQDIDPSDEIPDIRNEGVDLLELNATARYSAPTDSKFLRNYAVSAQLGHSISGFAEGKSQKTQRTTVTASMAADLGKTGISVAASGSHFNVSSTQSDLNGNGHSLSLRGHKSFEHATIRSQFNYSHDLNDQTDKTAAITVTAKSYNFPLPQNASLSIAPSASALYANGNTSARAGIYANLSSGELLGRKTQLNATFGGLQSLSANQGTKTDKFLTLSLARKVRLGDNMSLGLTYRNNLDGDHRVGLQLDGRFNFNDRRKYRETMNGRGVLSGQVFIDLNRDGIRQENERPIPRAIVRVKGTGMALKTDNSGYYTIQNINEGLYDIVVDGRSLPLGYSMPDIVQNRATIREGQITDVPLPIVQRGQIRGFTFLDTNGDGEYSQGESRVEGVRLELKSQDDDQEKRTQSTSFGQFAFDDLVAGEYQIVTTSLKSTKYQVANKDSVLLELDERGWLMQKIALPLIAKEAEMLAEGERNNDPPLQPPDISKNTMTPNRIGAVP